MSNNMRPLMKNFDLLLFGLTMIASVFGIIMVASVSGTMTNPYDYIITQSVALALGLVCIYFIVALDYEYMAKFAYYLFGFSVFLLILVLIPGIGIKVNGARRWMGVGSTTFQPSEFVKIFFIITFAAHLEQVERELNRPLNVMLLLAHVGIICALLLMQPDLGAALAFVTIFVIMIFLAGLSYKYIISAIVLFAAAAPAAWMWVLKDYQKNRIISFFNPEKFADEIGYHVVQSKIAVGSGQIFGKGLFGGITQYYLPERHTDFIYAVIGEELGFLGAIAILALLLAIVLRCFYISQKAKNPLGRYISAGVAAMLLFQIVENVGMCIGIMPVTGLTLPFISYGGTSLMMNLIAVGLVLNVRCRYKVINF